MKKQLIMAAVGIALASGLAVTTASAAPVSTSGLSATDKSTSLAEKTHYRDRYNNHHRHSGWRKWRPRMFGYLRHRDRHHHHRHYHQRRHYY